MIHNFKKLLNKKVIISSVLIVAVAVSATMVKVKYFSKSKSAETAARCTDLSKRNLSSNISTSGNIKSSNSSAISSSLNTAVSKINVKLGDAVKKGDVVAVMDTTELETEIASLQSTVAKNVEKAKSTLDAKKAALDSAEAKCNSLAASNTSQISTSIEVSSHIKGMASTSSSQSKGQQSSGSGSSMQGASGSSPSTSSSSSSNSSSQSESPAEALEKAKSEYQSALSEYENAGNNEDLQNKQAELSKAQITAPFDGTITAIHAVQGEICSGSLFEIQDLNSLIVDVNVSENDISKVKVGQKATIVVDAVNSEALEGEVMSVSPVSTNSSVSSSSSSSGASSSKSSSSSSAPSSAGASASGSSSSSSSSVTFSAEVKINTSNEDVKVGMSSVVNIVLEESDEVFAVPYESIVKDGNSSYIYVADEENGKYVVKEIPVKEGMESDIYVEISSSDIKEGMKVLANPSAYEVGSTIDINSSNQRKSQGSNKQSGGESSKGSKSENNNNGGGDAPSMPNGAPPSENK